MADLGLDSASSYGCGIDTERKEMLSSDISIYTDIVMTKTSNVPLDHQGCTSYNIHVIGENATSIELEIDGLLGFKSVVTVPRHTFSMNLG